MIVEGNPLLEAQLKISAALEAEKARREWVEKLESMGLGIRYENCKFDDFQDVSGLREKVKEFITSSAWSFFLYGKPGCGKTHLSVAFFRFLYDQETYVRFFSFMDLCKRLRGDPAFLTDCPYVIIDDLGSQMGIEWDKDVFTDFLNKRYNKMQKTLITSNLNIEEVGKFLDARVISRLKEGTVVATTLQDYRIKRKAA